MQLDNLINELTRIRAILSPDTEIRLLDDNSMHTYNLYDIRFKEMPVALEHTCDSHMGYGYACECSELGGCLVCMCPGCDDEPENTVIYFQMGEQNPYDGPDHVDFDEMKRVME